MQCIKFFEESKKNLRWMSCAKFIISYICICTVNIKTFLRDLKKSRAIYLANNVGDYCNLAISSSLRTCIFTASRYHSPGSAFL